MFTLETEIIEDKSLIRVHYRGAIVETSNLSFDADACDNADIFCSEVKRINSMGIKHWITTFEKLRNEGKRIRFRELSVPLVIQSSFVRGMVSPKEVESFFVPFFCETCESEHVYPFTTEEVQKTQYQIPSRTCPKCEGPLEFDANPATYFTFIKG